MSGPELPVIYENPRFDKATPTLKPVVDRAVRFTGVILMEWGTLTLIEESPRYLKVATIVVAALVLAVHESWPWLRMRDWRWYPSLMVILLASYIGVFAYALITEPSHKSVATSPQSTTQAPPVAPISAPVVQVDRRKNPLNDDAAKWQVISRLHDSNSVQKIPKCQISIVRYQLTYAEDFADDLKIILKVADWPYTESFATSQVPRGLTVRTSDRQNESQRCGSAVQGALRNSTLWKGGTWSVNNSYFPHDSSDCDSCIEIDIGNDPDAP